MMASSNRKRSSSGTAVAQRSIASSCAESLHASALKVAGSDISTTKILHRMVQIKIVDSCDNSNTKTNVNTGKLGNKSRKQASTSSTLAVQSGPIYIPPRTNPDDFDKNVMPDIFTLSELQQSFDSGFQTDETVSLSSSNNSNINNRRLQRFPIKSQTQNGDTQTAGGTHNAASNPKSSNNMSKRSTQHSDDDSKRFLLNNLLDELSAEDCTHEYDPTEKSLFVQDLVLSMLTSSSPSTTPPPSTTATTTEESATQQKQQQLPTEANVEKINSKSNKVDESKVETKPASITDPPMSNGTCSQQESNDSPSSCQKSIGQSLEVSNNDDDRPNNQQHTPQPHPRLYLTAGAPATGGSSRIGCTAGGVGTASTAAAAEYSDTNTSEQVAPVAAMMKNNLR